MVRSSDRCVSLRPKDILKNCLTVLVSPGNDNVHGCQDSSSDRFLLGITCESAFQCEPHLKEFPLTNKHRIALAPFLQVTRFPAHVNGGKSAGLWP
jgi:hypothetical protein